MTGLTSARKGPARIKPRRRQPGRLGVAFNNANAEVPADCLPRIQAFIEGLDSSPKVDYLRSHYLSKFVSSETDPAEIRRSRAIEKWLATEAKNEETNERLSNTEPGLQILPGLRYERYCEWVRGFISRLIGDTVPECALVGTFSGGASTSRRRTEGHPALKFVGQADITESAREWFDLVLTAEGPVTTLPSITAWQRNTGFSSGVQSLQTVRGSILFTVPKNATIDRVACKEPDINMFLQKGAGSYIRRRLRRFGIDLNDQSRNRSLAEIGSRDGSLATLDLSSASDSVSCSLVETLLPVCWYSYLDDIRSHWVSVDGEWRRCEMFSSMGNGFTFELESLLFFALAKGVAYFGGHKGVISVYGDDIIVPTSMAEDFMKVLDYFGFSVNKEKSFWRSDDPFRESCGGHYHNGVDISPFYIRGPIKTLIDLIHFLNQFRIWASRGESLFLDEQAWPLWNDLSRIVPRMFWGGDLETSGKFQLISPGRPHKRLKPVLRKLKRLPDCGLYLLDLASASQGTVQPVSRDGDSFTTSDSFLFVHSGLYRISGAKHYGWHDSGMKFLAELNPDGVLE